MPSRRKVFRLESSLVDFVDRQFVSCRARRGMPQQNHIQVLEVLIEHVFYLTFDPKVYFGKFSHIWATSTLMTTLRCWWPMLYKSHQHHCSPYITAISPICCTLVSIWITRHPFDFWNFKISNWLVKIPK